MAFPFENIEYSYSCPAMEARACRKDCALFDFSFVRRVRLTGDAASDVVEAFQRRIVRDMPVGGIRYSLKTDSSGTVRSDLTIWRVKENSYEVMTGHPLDVNELLQSSVRGIHVEDLSVDTAILSLQGPGSLSALDGLTDIRCLSALPYFNFTSTTVGNIECLIARLGYTGERGFELIVNQSDLQGLWNMLSTRACTAGYAAANILRIEAGFFLFTQEGLVCPTVAELGMEHLFADKFETPICKMVAFSAQCDVRDPIWRPDECDIVRPCPGQIIITSACFSPHFDHTIGLGFVATGPETDSPFDPSGCFRDIHIQTLPIFDPCKKIPRQPWHATPRP